jgi:mono/diheme cytochrome c family protein
MRRRLTFLITTIGIAVFAVACGRATQDEINSALGITPTATLSVEQVATGTALAISTDQTRTAAVAAMTANPGSGSPVSLVDVADIVQGKTQFQLRCLNCHKVSGSGSASALAGVDNPATTYSDQELIDLIRSGEGHAAPPGPLTSVTISDRQLINIIGYIRDQSK